MTYDEIDVAQLGSKLEALSLGTGERAALEALLAFAAPGASDDLKAASVSARLHDALFEPASLCV